MLYRGCIAIAGRRGSQTRFSADGCQRERSSGVCSAETGEAADFLFLTMKIASQVSSRSSLTPCSPNSPFLLLSAKWKNRKSARQRD